MNNLENRLTEFIENELTNEALELINDPEMDQETLIQCFSEAIEWKNSILIEAFLAHPDIKISEYRNHALVRAGVRGQLEVCEKILNHPTFNNNIFAHHKETKHPVKQMIYLCSRKQDPPATLIESIITKFPDSDLYFEDNWLLKYCYKHNNQKLIGILLENETVKDNLFDASIFESINEKNIADFKTC